MAKQALEVKAGTKGSATAQPVARWAGRTPRAWQEAALPLALAAIKAKARSVVSAIMGSGKSVLIAEICASGRGRVVITVPTVALVDQLHITVGARCPGEVGRFYTHAKEADKRITICCLPSLPALVADKAFTKPALWIADEAHKTENDTVKSAYAALAPSAAIGFTATPFRAKLTEELSLWDVRVYEYGAKEAFKDGVVVRPELRQWTGADAPLDEVCVRMIQGALTTGPGLVNAGSIDDAEDFAQRLWRAGIPAGVVHSRQSRADQAKQIEALKSGASKVLVHVNMLSEGVDLPWLRWLCMRRPIGSRVRFCQEVGRVLRAYPGKDSAILLDPHDLFDRFGLTYEAILAGMAIEVLSPCDQALADAEKEDEAGDEDGDFAADKPERIVRQRAAWRRYLRTLYLTALTAGVVEQRIKSTGWRSNPPSPKQLAAVRWAVAGLARDTTVPIAHRKMLAKVSENCDKLLCGDVSDLLTLGFAIRDGRNERRPVWPLLAAAEAAAAGDADPADAAS